MPQQFYNTPEGKPLNVSDARERLQKLVNKGYTDDSEAAQKFRSRIIERHQSFDKQKESSVQETNPQRETQRVGEEIETEETQRLVEAEQKLEQEASEEAAEQNQQSLRKEVVLEDRDRQEINETESADKAVVTEEVEDQLKGLSITSGEYWHKVWGMYIKDGEITQDEKKIILEIRLPQDNEVEIAAAEQMYAGLVGAGQKPGKLFETIVDVFPKIEGFLKNPKNAIGFEIAADAKDIRFWVVVPGKFVDFMERQIHGAYPEADISKAETKDFLLTTGSILLTELRSKGKIYFPIRVAEEFEVDPLSGITSAVSKLHEDDRVVLQFLIQPADNVWRQRGKRFLHKAQAPPTDEKAKKATVDPKIIEAVSNKISKAGFRVTIRIFVQSKDKDQAQHLTRNIVGSFHQFSLPHLAVLNEAKVKMNKGLVESFITRSFPKWGNYPVLNTMELATLYHFPNQNIQTPKIKWLKFRKSAPPTNLPSEGLYLGINDFRSVEAKIRLQRKDRRRHMYVIGQTGTGKSEFLKHLAQQDIVNGEGLAFIDPHGEAVQDLLKMVPKERAEDVIYFNPGDSERPMGINILDAKTEEGKHLVVNSFIALLYKLYDPNRTGMVGPQLERAVRNVMLTAMSEEGNSMVEVLRLLIDPKFAESKIHLIKDPLVKSYWVDQMAQTNEFHRSEQLGYFVSKFDRFVTEKLMRNIIGQSKSVFDFREVMDEQKILLVNLSKGTIGEENSNFLGLILVPRILAAAMGRTDIPEENRKDFYLYVDEFQNFATPDFATILAEARKYRLNLVVANQYISQVQEEIRNAVFGNVGTMVSFRVGTDDGEYLEKQFAPVFNQNDVINLTIGQCVLRLLIGGQPSRPFSFKTDWSVIQALPRSERVAGVIKEICRLKYGRDRRLVESEIATRAGFE